MRRFSKMITVIMSVAMIASLWPQSAYAEQPQVHDETDSDYDIPLDDNETEDAIIEKDEAGNETEDSEVLDITDAAMSDGNISDEEIELNEETEAIDGGTDSLMADPYVPDGASYGLTWSMEGGEVYITGYTGIPAGELIIPANIGGKEVVAIQSNAFKNCNLFTGDLEIPSSVRKIGLQAFWGCSGLTSVSMPGVLEVQERAFFQCSGLKRVDFGESLQEIEMLAFSECTGLEGDLTLPNSLTEMGESAFKKCTGFTGDLQISKGLKKIPQYAFSESGFKGNLIIPEGVETVDEYAFYKCSGFTGDLVLPESLKTLNQHAFHNCTGFDGELTIKGVLLNEIPSSAFYGCSGFTGALVIPNSVKTVRGSAFYNCAGFSKLMIPDSVSTIWGMAFNGCSGLKSVVNNSGISVDLSGIDSNAIWKNAATGETISSLPARSLAVRVDGSQPEPDSQTYTLQYSYGMDHVVVTGITGTASGRLIIPEEEPYTGLPVTVIDSGAFSGKSGFTGELVIPDSITTIGAQAFLGCSGFTGTLSIPDSVTSIGSQAFGCGGITKIINNSSVTADIYETGHKSFDTFTLNEVGTTVGSGQTIIRDDHYELKYSYDEDDHTATVTGVIYYPTGTLRIPATDPVKNYPVTQIADNAFVYKTEFIGELVLPDSLTEIGSSAFMGCTGLTGQLNLPGGLTTIGQNAFYMCSGFNSELHIADSVETIGAQAFGLCNNLCGSLTLPANLRTIGNGAFTGCTGFRGDLEIPEGVVSISDSSFSDCAWIKKVINNSSAVFNLTNCSFGKTWMDPLTGTQIEEISEGTAVRVDSLAENTVFDLSGRLGVNGISYTDITNLSDQGNSYKYTGTGDVSFKVVDANAYHSKGFYLNRNMVTFRNAAPPNVERIYYTDENGVVTVPEHDMMSMIAGGESYYVKIDRDPERYSTTGYLSIDSLGNKVALRPVTVGMKPCGNISNTDSGSYFNKNTNSVSFELISGSSTEIIGAFYTITKRHYEGVKKGNETTYSLVESVYCQKTRLEPSSGQYTVYLNEENGVDPEDFENDALCITITPIIKEYSRLDIAFYRTDRDDELFDGSDENSPNDYDLMVRVDAGTYEAVWDSSKNIYHVDGIPRGSNVSVKLTPKSNCLWKAEYARITDSNKDNVDKYGNLKNIKSSTLEYTVKLVDKTSGRIDIYMEPINRLVVRDGNGYVMEPAPKSKDKYNIKYDQNINISVESPDGPVYAKFSDESEWSISGSPSGLGWSGKTVNISAKAGNETLKATFVCSAYPRTVDIKDFKYDSDIGMRVSEQTFDTDKSYKVTFTKGVDLSNINAYLLDNNGNKTDTAIDDEYAGVGRFDAKTSTLYFEAEKMVDSGNTPGESYVDFAFFDGSSDTPIGYTKYRLNLTGSLTGKTPTVTEDRNLTTAYGLGIKLSLPSGVKASPHLFYVVEAISDNADDRTRDGNECYMGTNTRLIPSLEKSAFVDVYNSTESDRLAGTGWSVPYKVDVKLEYYKDIDEYGNREKIGSLASRTKHLEIATKAPSFETRASLTKKAPSKVFIGQNGILAALIKYSNNTTVRRIGEARLFAPDGRECDYWNGWGDEPLSDQGWMSIDNAKGEIYLNTYIVPDEYDPNDDNSPQPYWLSPGKYTIMIYAADGGGKKASASVQVNVVNSIGALTIKPEANRIYKPYNKKASMKTAVSYFNQDGGSSIESKKVVWSIVGTDGNELPDFSPLNGMVSIASNGTVSVDPKLLVDDSAEDNYKFCIKATSADYIKNEDNSDRDNAVVISDPIQISSQIQVPTYIQLAWHWDEYDDSGYIVDTHHELSDVVYGGTYYSNEFDGTMIYVYDQNFEQMDATKCSVKISGLIQDAGGRLHVKSAGKASIVATALDGGKKSCKLDFTVKYVDDKDNDIKLTTLIQSAEFEWAEADYNEVFHNAFLNVEWADDGEGNYKFNPLDGPYTNDIPEGKPFYVYVAGCRAEAGVTDYDSNTMINHSASIVSGGKITATEYGVFERYTRYTVLPSASVTKIKVIDKTKGRKAADHTYVYEVKNSRISDSKSSATISADKKSILNSIWDLLEHVGVDEDRVVVSRYYSNIYGNDIDNPNNVIYTIKKAENYPIDPGKELVVNVTMDPIKAGDSNNETIAYYLGLTDKEKMLRGKVYATDNGTFNLKFFERKTVRRYVKENNETPEHEEDVEVKCFDGVAKGKYTFYATVGQATVTRDESGVVTDIGGDYKALAKPAKITVSVGAAAKPTVKFATSKIELLNSGRGTVLVPKVSNGMGVHHYFLTGTNKSGSVNKFTELFEIDAVDDMNINIAIRPGVKLGSVVIGSGKSAVEYKLQGLYDLKALMNGKLKDDINNTIVSEAAQKAAYKKWKTDNCSGFIGYAAIRMDGVVVDENYAALTVDIDQYIAALH